MPEPHASRADAAGIAAGNEMSDCPLAAALASQLRASRAELVGRWLERISSRVTLDRNRVFPTDELLDHVPILIDGIADYLENPAAEVSIDIPVVSKALELGALRHEQGFDAYEILKEYEILGGIIFSALATAADAMPEPCAKSELLYCGQRLFRAIAIIQQTTTTHFLQLSDKKVAEREYQLRAFSRALSHEIKNRIGTIIGAGEVLGSIDDQPRCDRQRFHDIILRNARAMSGTVDDLLVISRIETDSRQHHNVRLSAAAHEAARQVREAAHTANVTVVVREDLPNVEVNAAVVELSLTNYLANAIKYRDAAKPQSRVEISADLSEDVARPEVRVYVTDNGPGVAVEKRDQLFQRFSRVHETSTVPGTGLGLSIVRDAVESIGGRAWAEFPSTGSVFAFALPGRRANDADALPPACPSDVHRRRD